MKKKKLTNSERRLPNVNGKMFIPLPFGVSTSEESFIDGFKIGKLVAIMILDIVLINKISLMYELSTSSIFLLYGLLFYINTLLIRYLILDETYYYKLYLKMKKNKISTPSIFWDIASITDTERGSYITYGDLKVGAIIKVYRATVAGRPDSYKEIHYDAISDFYNFLNANGYSFVQMNIMETANNDRRLLKLDDLTTNSENENLNYLMEVMVTHIKAVSKVTLSENDYWLIYTTKDKHNQLLEDIPKAVNELKKGAYSSYDILNSEEISDLLKEFYGVRYFDPNLASLSIFGNEMDIEAFKIVKIIYEDGTVKDFELEELEKKQKIKERIQKNKENGVFNKIRNKQNKNNTKIKHSSNKKEHINEHISDNLNDYKIKNLKQLGENESLDNLIEEMTKDEIKFSEFYDSNQTSFSENEMDNEETKKEDTKEENVELKDEIVEVEEGIIDLDE